jgi:uncharacterized protein YdeI (YjbR/CyaY-like superfamily)
MSGKIQNELIVLAVLDQKSWAKWLRKNHLSSPGIWMQIAKKNSGIASVTYTEAVETALCYGWIDGQKQSHNADAWLQKFTPRGKRSIWSQLNREKALALMECGQMQAAGLAEIEQAKQDGRWEQAYDSPRRAAIPHDLRAALNKNARAKAF